MGQEAIYMMTRIPLPRPKELKVHIKEAIHVVTPPSEEAVYEYATIRFGLTPRERLLPPFGPLTRLEVPHVPPGHPADTTGLVTILLIMPPCMVHPSILSQPRPSFYLKHLGCPHPSRDGGFPQDGISANQRAKQAPVGTLLGHHDPHGTLVSRRLSKVQSLGDKGVLVRLHQRPH